MPPDAAGELDADLLNSFFLATASGRPAAAADMPWGKTTALGTRKAFSSSALSPSRTRRLELSLNGLMEPYLIPVPAHPCPLGANDRAAVLLACVLLMGPLNGPAPLPHSAIATGLRLGSPGNGPCDLDLMRQERAGKWT